MREATNDVAAMATRYLDGKSEAKAVGVITPSSTNLEIDLGYYL